MIIKTKYEEHTLCERPAFLPLLHSKVAIGILVFLILIIFGGTSRFDFINYDDNIYIYENTHVSTGLSKDNLKWALTDTKVANLWHPLTWVSHMTDVELFGTKNAGGHHAVNVFWHMLATVGFYLILARLIANHWLALMVVAVWAIHPQRVQSVAWISERKDVLSGAFFFWSWLVWEIGRSHRDKARLCYCVSLILFILAALSKPSVIPLPLILLIREVYRGDGPKLQKTIKWSLRLVPFFIVSSAVALLTIYLQRIGGLADLTQTLPLRSRLILMPVSLWWYIQHFFWPGSCELWVSPPKGLLSEWLAPLIGLFVTACLIILGRRNHLIQLGAGIYLILWLPVSGLVPVSFYYVADRYAYLPQVGIIIVLAGFILTALQYIRKTTTLKIASVFAMIAISVLSLLAWKKTSYWKNSEILFSHEHAINKRSFLALIKLGIVKDKQEKHQESLACYLDAIKINKASGMAYTGAGRSLLKLGRKEEAEKAFAQANQCKGLQKEASYFFRAKLMVERNAILSAEGVLNEGLRRFPRSIILMLEQATLARRYKNDANKALEWYQKALEIAPYHPDAMEGKGMALIQLGKGEEAKEILRKLIERYPERKAIKTYLDENPE